jgi:DNA-binding response OmpR family regulator
MRVVVVEDDVEMAAAIRRGLRFEGVVVDLAGGGRTAAARRSPAGRSASPCGSGCPPERGLRVISASRPTVAQDGRIERRRNNR